MNRIIKSLSNKGILSPQEENTLRDMINTLNQAAHGVEFDQRTAEWIIKNGPQIIYSLDSKINNRGGKFTHDNPESKEHWIDVSYNNQNWQINSEWSDHIKKHLELWQNEIGNLSDAIIKKINDPDKIVSFKNTQENWKKQVNLEKEFLLSIDNIEPKNW